MKKENDIILVSLVMIIVLSIVLVSVSINLISGKNGIIQKIEQVQEVNVEQINSEKM